MEILLDWISRPDVGCVFPYFSSNRGVGDEVQRVGFSSRGGIACEPSTMTLSLNLFKRQVLEQICGLDENYLFGFAEPILLIKIRSLGFRAVMAGGTHASHYDQLTNLLGESSLGIDEYVDDVERWFREYPDYAATSGVANIDVRRWPFATTLPVKLLWTLGALVPGESARAKLMNVAMWLEPFLTRYPARSGKAKMSHAQPGRVRSVDR